MLCDEKGQKHPEWKGTVKEGTNPNFKSHRPLPPDEDYVWDSHFGWVREGFGFVFPDPPKNLDGITNVASNLYDPYTTEPLYTYYYPEQWNKNNPLYPLPPYANRPKPPTKAELDAAAAQYGTNSTSTDPPVIITTPAYAF